MNWFKKFCNEPKVKCFRLFRGLVLWKMSYNLCFKCDNYYAEKNLLYVLFYEVLNAGNRSCLLSTFITYFNLPYIALNNISTTESFCFKVWSWLIYRFRLSWYFGCYAGLKDGHCKYRGGDSSSNESLFQGRLQCSKQVWKYVYLDLGNVI